MAGRSIVRILCGKLTEDRPHALRPDAPLRSKPTDARTAATMRELMEDVMLEGTGQKSQLDGYTPGENPGRPR